MCVPLLQGHLLTILIPFILCTAITTVLYVIVEYLAKTRLNKVKPKRIVTQNGTCFVLLHLHTYEHY